MSKDSPAIIISDIHLCPSDVQVFFACQKETDVRRVAWELQQLIYGRGQAEELLQVPRLFQS